MGERTPLAFINPSAASRMALGEALTNIAAADITELKQVRLSGNWMAAASDPQQAAALYEAVKAIGLELAPALDLTIPVGKDSLSMRTQWADQAVLAPLSLVISAFAPVKDVRHTLTPYLRPEPDSCLLYIDLANGLMRLGNSCLAQITNQLGSTTPDVETPAQLLSYFKVLQQLREQQQILAYHDRSDGGLWVTLCEYLFASRIGLEVNLGALTEDPTQWIPALFNEELGAVIQIYNADLSAVQTQFKEVGIATAKLATLNLAQDEIRLYHAKSTIYQQSRVSLQALWSRPGYEIQKLRDNSSCAQEAYLLQLSPENLGLRPHLSFTPTKIPRSLSFKPKVAILREQGVNGHLEMAAAFTQAGFLAIDVHMTDLIAQRQDLAQFQGLAVCGGFSYGDVLGAGQGWAKSILFHPRLRTMFEQFFARADTFSLGVCNGCQMLSGLKTLIPGAQHWPTFVRNRSNRFEARLAQVKIQPSPSILFKGMQGSQLPIVVSHGEGQVAFASEAAQQAVMAEQLVSLAYVNSAGEPTMTYPDNPNGSIHGITGLTSSDGRVTLIMPHPERTFRTVQFSWCPSTWQQSPWMNLFYNARNWLNQQ
jgi:phosphoribosylformylglycinamidine synthase